MSLRLRPVEVATGCDDTEGRLVFRETFLVAVLVRLSDDHGDEAGRWFLETGFGPVGNGNAPTFADLDEAQDWIARHLAGSRHAP